MKRLLILAFALFTCSPLLAQNQSAWDLAYISTPADTDAVLSVPVGGVRLMRTDRHSLRFGLVPTTTTITCVAPLKCSGSSSMDLSAGRTLSVSGPDSLTQAVTCDGVSADDTASINAAITTLQAGRCGVLLLSGNCAMANSIVNNPGSSSTCPLVVEGDGRNATNITFSSCSSGSGDCIFLGSQGTMGGGRNDGSGVRHIRINPASGSVGVHIKNLQGFDVTDVYIEGGGSALRVEESRFGNVLNLYAHGFTVDGVNVVGETYAANWFTNLDIVSTSGVNGFNYTKTGTTDAGGIYLSHVIVNGTLSGSGILLSDTTINNVYLFCDHCVADGNFTNDSIRLKNIIMGRLTDVHAVNKVGTGAAALTLDGVYSVDVNGGVYIGSTGTGGADISLKNTVSRVVINGPALEGNQQAIKVDGTTHCVDIRPGFFLSSTLTNDPTKIVPCSTLYAGGKTFFTGTTTASMLGLLSPAGSSAQYQAVDSSGNYHLYASNGSTNLLVMTQAGKLGVGTAAPPAAVTISANAATLPSPSATGTLLELGQIDGVSSRFSIFSFATNSSIDFIRADGTAASPTAVQANEVLGQLAGFGYDGTSYPSSSSAFIQELAAAAFSNSSHPTMLRFGTTPASSTTATEIFRIDQQGHLQTLGTAPTVACTGTGTAPTAPTIDGGGTDNKFTINMPTGTGSPGSTGTCTVTFASAFLTNKPVLICTCVAGASGWGNEANTMVSVQSLTAPVISWANEVSGTLTALSVSTSYKISCLALQ